MIKIDWWEIIKVFFSWWPVWTLCLVIVAVRLFFDWFDFKIEDWHIRRRFKKGEAWRDDRELLHWLQGMRPSEFEDYIAVLFKRLGYRTEITGGSHDQGVDVIAEKDGLEHLIQCKKFITSTVSVGAVRDFYGAIADHLAKGKAYFITTNKFTLEAEKFAEDKPIELVDGHRLIEYIRFTEKEESKLPEAVKTEIEKCPQCGGNLIQREGKFGKFFGCSNYPKCNFTKKF